MTQGSDNKHCFFRNLGVPNKLDRLARLDLSGAASPNKQGATTNGDLNTKCNRHDNRNGDFVHRKC